MKGKVRGSAPRQLHNFCKNARNRLQFHYVDNVAAKRRLQKLMDDSLSYAIGRKQRRG